MGRVENAFFVTMSGKNVNGSRRAGRWRDRKKVVSRQFFPHRIV